VTDAPETLAALEQRAWDDPAAQGALLIACARAVREPSLAVDGAEESLAASIRALDLLDALAVDYASLGREALEAASCIARTLGRNALSNGHATEALGYFLRAREWSNGTTSVDDRAEGAYDLAIAYERLGETARAIECHGETLSLARACADPRARGWFVRRACTALAQHAREALSDEARAAAYERESDLADDEDIERESRETQVALGFFCAAWADEDAPPTLPIEASWLGRSTGEARRAGSAQDPFEGLGCPRIFGPERDFTCACGVFRGRARWGEVCDACGVERARSARRRSRIGHLTLPARVLHPIALERGPTGSLVALALDVPDARVREVFLRARCLRWRVERARGADTVAPDAPELAAYDRGEGDPALRFATGEDALCEALDGLDLEGALREVRDEARLLGSHASARSAAGRERLRWLTDRERALTAIDAMGGGAALSVERVPVMGPRWIEEHSRGAEIRAAYESLAGLCEALRDVRALGTDELRAVREALDELVRAIRG
jgi:tetratricopeptide (TPR) repeat protein